MLVFLVSASFLILLHVLNPLLQLIFRKPYGVHSPFVYRFAEQCLYADAHHSDFDVIKGIHQDYLHSSDRIEVTDMGAGKRFAVFRLKQKPAGKTRRVSSVARKAVQKPKYLRLFYRMSAWFQPQQVIELGTSLGISALSFAMGNPAASVSTIEGCPETARLASQTFAKAGVGNIRLYTGSFKKTLPGVLQGLPGIDMAYIDGDHTYKGTMHNIELIRPHLSEQSVLIIDDIRWSHQMWGAWKAISTFPEVTLSLDLGRLGVIFFRKELSKQKIRLWF